MRGKEGAKFRVRLRSRKQISTEREIEQAEKGDRQKD